MQIPLINGDRVIASFPHRDKVLVITEFGEVFIIEVGDDFSTGSITVSIQQL
jgi:hypothetical protein